MSKEILDKLDALKEDLYEIKVVQARNRQTLVDHARRSTASEGRLALLEAVVEKLTLTLTRHLGFLRGAIWTVSGLITLMGLLSAAAAWYLKLKGTN